MVQQMLAVVKQDGATEVRQVPVPSVQGPDELVVRVMQAGICRTDLLAADNRLPTNATVILGHEFSGVIQAAGAQVRRLREGDRVAVNPIGACKACPRCRDNDETNCFDPVFLGLRRDGAFAQFVRVPQTEVFKLPESLPFAYGAYAEPVAAVLAIFNAGIRPDERGLVCGTNRIAKLVERILRAKGFEAIECADAPEGLRAPAGGYDFAIETSPTPRHFAMMLQAIRPKGKIVLRSRVHQHVEFPLQLALPKEPVIHVVNYGSFQEAVDLLAARAIDLDDLLGRQYPLEAFAEAFVDARANEASKLFFAIGP